MLLAVSFATVLLVRHYRGLGRLIGGADPSQEMAPIGPAGQIEAIEIPLANPEGNFPDKAERLAQPKWFFDGFSEQSLTRLFKSCELRPAERKVLVDKRYWETRTNGIVLTPPEQLVWSLSHRGRQQIYSALARSPLNYSQKFPFRFPLNGFDLKFKQSGLPAAQLDRIRRLTYTNGGYLCFTDLRAVQPFLKPADFKDLIESLYAVPTFLLRLRVAPDSDVEALAKYWGRGGREKMVAPILTALTKVPGGGAINLSYLLPPFARLRLYTFPEAWTDPTVTAQDCLFTAMNFFNETPDTNFLDGAYSRKVLESDYEPVPDNPTFGDVVTLFNQQGEAVHACVYIAADFVFTKNGINAEQPWVLMRLADM
jgi:hypothetical protein